MKELRGFFLLAVFLFILPAGATRGQQPQPPSRHVVDLKAPDGALLKATYFAAAKPGRGVLLLHQVNRERKSWDGVAAQLAPRESTP